MGVSPRRNGFGGGNHFIFAPGTKANYIQDHPPGSRTLGDFLLCLF